MKRYSRVLISLITFVSLSLVAAISAKADITILEGNNPQIDENVLLHQGESGLSIFGTTNQSLLTVRFSSNEVITSPANGQARIEALDGMLTTLTIDLNGASFTSLILNLDASADGAVNFVVNEVGGQVNNFNNLEVDGSGQNFFTILASNDQRILSVSFTSAVPMTLFFSDVAQFRIGGFDLGPGQQIVIPEPMSLMLLGTGLAGLGYSLRRRLKKN